MRVTATATSRLALSALAAALVALGAGAGSARADSNPLPGFPFYSSAGKEGPGYVAPPGGFEGPCGLAVDSVGNFYVADYYRHGVDVFKPPREYLTQLTGEDPLDGPCGLAVDSVGRFYVNDFHRDLARFSLSPFPPTVTSKFGPVNGEGEVEGTVIDSEHPTGVAVDPGTGNVYVDDRTYVAVYDPSGAPLEEGGEPLRIGLGSGSGSLGDGYGVAVSEYPATAGYVYVPDAADNTVKVYDPAVDVENPVEVIDGHETPAGGFVSLRDAAIAVDSASGEVYVADDLQPGYFERPEAAIYGFDPSGAYAGRLKYNIVDARPPGLAVDNSGKSTQGRVYVTSGNTEGAAVYAYAPGSLTTSVEPAPAAAATALGEAGAGASVLAPAAVVASAAGSAATPAGTAVAAPMPRARQRRHSRPHHSRQRHRRARPAHGRRR